jgi:recombination protein RecA
MKRKRNSLSAQAEARVSKKPVPEEKEKVGNFKTVIHTGSTLLDLVISGSVHEQGGLPGGIMVEIFGPSGSGKTVLLSEIAGAIQRESGEISFFDPEARLNKQFASMFDLDVNNMQYATPDRVPELFKHIREWDVDNSKINGVMADSLAALSTDIEMDNEEGDKMGMRRAKEFSEGLRKHARIIKQKNLLFVCSNQVRTNQDAGPYGQKHISPGGEAIAFYSSVRLRTFNPKKLKKKTKVAGKTIERVVGVETMIDVYKNSVAAPYGKAPVYILFDYGIDDVRANLQFIKEYSKNTVYTCAEQSLSNSMEEAIEMVEEQGLEDELKQEVIELWHAIERKFKNKRKRKKRK